MTHRMQQEQFPDSDQSHLHGQPPVVVGKQVVDGSPRGEEAGVETSAAAAASPDGGVSGQGDGDDAGYYYVRTYAWTPEFGQQEVVLDACSGAEAGEVVFKRGSCFFSPLGVPWMLVRGVEA